jgi:polysaccharide transporter, PST family
MKVGPPTGMRALAARGAAVTGIAQAYRTALSFLSGLVLARLLKPADFGLIAMVSTCVGFVTLFQDLGLVAATIQRERISQAQISALFWLAVGASVALTLALAASAPAIAWFYDEPRLVNLTLAFATLVFISGWQSQPFALLNREMRFQALAVIDVFTATAGYAGGIAIAWLTSSYWALFAGPAISAIVSLACVWLVCDFRPSRPSFEGDFREILHFGSGLSGFNIVTYFARNADNILIGKFYGSEQLGLYDRAYRLLMFPLSQVTWPLGRVVVPLLSRTQSVPERYRKIYSESITLIMLATQPGIMFATVYSSDIFRILLGPSWMSAAPIFSWLGLCGLQQVMTSSIGWVYVSQGRSVDMFKIGSFNAVVTVASFIIGLPWGPLGVAVAYTIANYAVLLPVAFWNIGLRGPVRTYDMIATTAPHALATASSGAMLFALPIGSQPLNLIMCFALTALTYVIYMLVLLVFPAKRQILSDNLRALALLRAHSG